VRFPDPAAGTGVGGGGFAQAADGAMVFFGGDWQAEKQAFGLGEGVEMFCSGDGFVPEEGGQAVGLCWFVSMVMCCNVEGWLAAW
jgi:hypothetical protein